jgi:hypothetical protein
MKKIILMSLLAAISGGAAKAQWSGTNPLYTFFKVGIGTSSPITPLHVQNGCVLFDGVTGSTPVSGAGTRMMWIPAKSAFRIGTVTGTQWDNANIGSYSFAGGYNSKAAGLGSMAYGIDATVDVASIDEACISLGYGTYSSGHVSVAIGDATRATGGGGATALGNSSSADGVASIAIGVNSHANATQATAIGLASTADGTQSMAIGSFGSADNERAIAISIDDAHANGDYSMAMGTRASNNGYVGSFAYGEYDPSFSGVPVENTADMQFMARARGGFVFHNDENLDEKKGTFIKDGNVGIGVDNMQAKLHVKDGAILADGTTGATPVSGPGRRMMWIPEKAAFRAGDINNTQWDNASIGMYSGCGGQNTIAEPPGSFVWGLRAVASNIPGAPQNQSCISLGANTTASGWASIALGNYAQAMNANGAYAIGGNAVATGDHSMALGGGAPSASGNKSVAIGPYSNSSGDEAMALGTYSYATGKNSLALSTYGANPDGDYSIAMGHMANNGSLEGCFSYADYDPSFSLPAVQNTTEYQFMARARGGFVFHNDANLGDDQALTFDHGNLGVGTGAGNALEKVDINGRLRIQDIPVNPTSTDILVKDVNGVINTRPISGLGTDGWEVVASPGTIPSTINQNIYRNGRVGVGTNNPIGQFHIVNPPCTNSPALHLTPTPSSPTVCGPGFQQGNLLEADDLSGNTKVVINANGTVGLGGTLNPLMLLDLYRGDMIFTGHPTNTYRIHYQYWLPNPELFISPTDASGNMVGTGIVMGTTGNVGIGINSSTTPGNRLQVNGNVVPANNCAFSLGTSSLRWNQIFLCNNPIIMSDKRLKTNIRNSEYGIEEIKKLRPVTYDLTTNEGDGRKIGLIAQEAQEVISEIVHVGDDADKMMGIKYSELIPVLITAIQQQQAMIDDMKTQLEKLQAGNANTNNTGNNGNNTSADDAVLMGAKLYQNTPNPFNVNTEIKYFLPEKVKEAMMVIYDLNGRQLRSYPLGQRGDGSVVVHGEELAAGMYLYSLIVEGREADTKRMVLSK